MLKFTIKRFKLLLKFLYIKQSLMLSGQKKKICIIFKIVFDLQALFYLIKQNNRFQMLKTCNKNKIASKIIPEMHTWAVHNGKPSLEVIVVL